MSIFCFLFSLFEVCLSFQFLIRGICIYFPIPTGIKIGRFISLKIGDILLKKILLKLNFLDEEQMYVNFLFYIIII